ncbi:hypothetical protein FB451DRAFT_1364966 [Mycena latifolia]|nr:hypothetical protein FB451DRAFT_1364966 [Mycena latifolia]
MTHCEVIIWGILLLVGLQETSELQIVSWQVIGRTMRLAEISFYGRSARVSSSSSYLELSSRQHYHHRQFTPSSTTRTRWSCQQLSANPRWRQLASSGIKRGRAMEQIGVKGIIDNFATVEPGARGAQCMRRQAWTATRDRAPPHVTGLPRGCYLMRTAHSALGSTFGVGLGQRSALDDIRA